MKRNKRMVLLGILTAQALVLHIAEGMLTLPFAVPGIRLGLANIVTMFAIAILGLREAVVVVVLRTLLGSAFGGGVTAFVYSMAGGLLSTLVMYTAYRCFNKLFSIPAVSVMGAAAHNAGQLLVACLAVGNINLFYYLPVLLAASVATGIFTGLTVQYVLKPLKTVLKIEKL